MTEKKRAGISFENDLNIKFEYDKDNDSVVIFKNGVPIAEGESVSPEELAEILTAYTTLTKLNTELAKYLTKNEANALATKSELAIYATKAELEDYATTAELDDYATKADLGDYATTAELADYATKAELADYATTAELADYATKAELDDYATKAELADYAEKTDVPVIEKGTTSTENIAAGSYVDFEITFTKTFASAPQVLANLSSTSTAAGVGNLEVAVTTTSTTGATIRVFNNDSTQRTPAVRWVAVL